MKLFRYFSLITVLGLSGCFNLDQSPQESIAAKDAYARVNDAQYWVNGMYVKLRNYVYGNYVQCTEAQADLLNATESYSRTYAPLHRWETLKADNGDLSTFWLDSYNTLSNINEALGGFPTIEPRDDDEKTRLAELTGELHLGRAYVYTRLVTAFGKVYDPATARTDLGVPLELVYNIKTTNKRATLDDTYAQRSRPCHIRRRPAMARDQGRETARARLRRLPPDGPQALERARDPQDATERERPHHGLPCISVPPAQPLCRRLPLRVADPK